MRLYPKAKAFDRADVLTLDGAGTGILMLDGARPQKEDNFYTPVIFHFHD